MMIKRWSNDGTMPPQSGGSRRVRYGAKPFDQETNAFIRRLSPRSANPECWNCGARTPPPGWMMLTGKAFGISIQGSKHHFTVSRTRQL